MSAGPGEDERIVCPRRFHKEDIERHGIYHCRMLVRRDAAQSDP